MTYQTLAPLLLNEPQREHKMVAAQAQQLAAMKSHIADFNEQLRAEMVQLRQLTARLTAAHGLDGGSPTVKIAPNQ